MLSEARLVEYGGKLYHWSYSDGYRLLRPVIDGKISDTGSVMEHRLVYELSHGVKLPDGFVVHHLNRNRSDNDPSNLIALSSSDHARLHRYEDDGKFDIDNVSVYRRGSDRAQNLDFEKKIRNIVAIDSSLYYMSFRNNNCTYYPIVQGKIDYKNPMSAVVGEDGSIILVKKGLAKKPSTNLEASSKKNYCIDCGVEIHRNATRCRACEYKHRRCVTNKVSKEELEELIQVKNNCEIAEMFGVSDTAVKKWRAGYGLPSSNEQHSWSRGHRLSINVDVLSCGDESDIV